MYLVIKGDEFFYIVDDIVGVNSGLKIVFEEVKVLEEGGVVVSIFEVYVLVGGVVFMFVVFLIYVNIFGEISFGGVVVICVEVLMFDVVVLNRKDFGVIGQVYVVNVDGMFLSNKFLVDMVIVFQEVSEVGVVWVVFSGSEVVVIEIELDGIDCLMVVWLIVFQGNNWVIVVEKIVEEIFVSVIVMCDFMMFWILMVIVVVMVIVIVFFWYIIKLLMIFVGVLNVIVQGDLNVEIFVVWCKDEIGDIG